MATLRVTPGPDATALQVPASNYLCQTCTAFDLSTPCASHRLRRQWLREFKASHGFLFDLKQAAAMSERLV